MKRTMILAGVLGIAVCGGVAIAATIPAYVAAAVSDPGRPASDTSRDANRLPAEMVAFAGIKPGMAVVDLLPGGGYFTRIFAKTVGPNGYVYAYYGNQGDARMRSQGRDPDNQGADLRRAYSNIHIVHGPLANFVTPQRVDVVWTSDNYHDLNNSPMAGDVAAMNKAIYASLKPGGYYVVIDHRAAKGAGAVVTGTLHRMDEDIAKQQIEAAGFKLVAEGRDLTRPGDDNTKRVAEAGEHDRTDQFMLKFQKPRK